MEEDQGCSEQESAAVNAHALFWCSSHDANDLACFLCPIKC